MDSELKTEEHVVAFIDVLGSKKMIDQNPDKSLNLIHDSYEKAERVAIMASSMLQVDYSVSIFSDNIVIAMKIDERTDMPLAVQLVTLLSIAFQRIMLQQGILTRGGLTVGGFFKDDTMVWGKALTKAYELESKLAIYPRVILDPSLASIMNVTSSLEFELSHFYALDQDGLYFADCCKLDEDMKLGFPSFIVDVLNADREKYRGDDRIVQKYNWLLNYAKRKKEEYEAKQ